MFGRALLISALVATLGACAMETRTVVVSDSVAAAGPIQAKPMAESRAACQSHGLEPYTERYERCVRNEYVFRVPG